MAKKAFQPSEEQRKQVERGSACGMTAEQIAQAMGIAESTLKKYFQSEFANGGIKANMNVAGALYRSAMEGNVAAQIFWCKTRLHWRETSHVELTGPGGTNPFRIVINGKELAGG